MLKCDKIQIDGEHCNAEPRFLCGRSHVLCRHHAVTIQLEGKRRSVDRQCLLCNSRTIIDFRLNSNITLRYRRATDNAQIIAAAELEVANQIVNRLRESEIVC